MAKVDLTEGEGEDNGDTAAVAVVRVVVVVAERWRVKVLNAMV